MMKKFSLLLSVAVLIVALAACTKDYTTPKDSKKAVTSFTIGYSSGVISEDSKTIVLQVPGETNVKALVPTILISERASVTPASGVAQDFSSPVVYTVTAEDETTETYTVVVQLATLTDAGNTLIPVITTSAASICAGGNVTLTVTPAPAGAAYKWYKEGIEIGSTNNPTYVATQVGSYSVIIKVENALSKMSAVTAVTQFSATAKPTVATTSATICGGASVTLTATYETAGVSYIWYKDGAELTGVNTATYSATEPGAYWVIAHDGACNSLASEKRYLTAGMAADAKPTLTAAPTTISGSVILTAGFATAGATYHWYKDGVEVASTTSTTYATALPGSYTVVAKVGVCSSLASDAVVLTSAIPASEKPTLTPSGATICGGSSVLLTASFSVAGVTYTWYKDGVDLGTTTGNTRSVTAAGSYTVVAKMGASSSLASDAVAIAAGIPINIKPTVVATTTTICSGGNFTLTATYTGGTGVIFIWYKDGTEVSRGTSANYTASAEGEYTVAAMKGTCVTQFSTPINITLAIPAGAIPTVTATPSTSLSGGNVTLTASFVVTSGVTYTWYKDGGSVGSGNPKVVAAPGTYYVVAKVGTCSSSPSTAIVVTP